MVILSFSVKEAEIQAGVKIRTTRVYTPEKHALWQRTLVGGDKTLQGWWKSRRPEGYKLFDRQGHDLFRMKWERSEKGETLIPARELVPMSGRFITMEPIEAWQYINEEGFNGDLKELSMFFEEHYPNVEDIIFQSIAFPPEE
jgi:hypothetical protein